MSFSSEHPHLCRNATYDNPIQDPGNFNWCVVPRSGEDALLFAGVGVAASCIVFGRFSTLSILLLGGLYEVLCLIFNLGRVTNALALWLGAEPSELLFYVFLPPLLLESAVRINFFLFKKMAAAIFSYAFLLVIISTLTMIPVMLYIFNLRNLGWMWQDAGLFAAMVASTDAVAVSALLKKGGGPEDIVTLMEGESLLNDATAISLFQVFFAMVKDLDPSKLGTDEPLSVLEQLGSVAGQILWLAVGGAIIGYIGGVAMRFAMRFMRRHGSSPDRELALSLAGAYLTFYIANAPLGASGVIATVVFGLYGNATAAWGMTAKMVELGTFGDFWDTIGLIVNGNIFFFSGASAINFFWRSTEELGGAALTQGFLAIWATFWRLPLIYLAIFVVRGLSVAALAPLLRLSGTHLTRGGQILSTLAALRGGISLILAQTLVLGFNKVQQDRVVVSQITLWTAGIVLLTLLLNAPLIRPCLSWLGLDHVPSTQANIRGKAIQALLAYSERAIHDLQRDDHEMLRGVDWSNVSSNVDCREELTHLLPDDIQTDDLQSIKLTAGSDTSSQAPFRSSTDERASMEDHNVEDHSLNTWSAQMAIRMLGSVPRRMSFRRKQQEKLPAGYGMEQPLLQQDSRIEEDADAEQGSSGDEASEVAVQLEPSGPDAQPAAGESIDFRKQDSKITWDQDVPFCSMQRGSEEDLADAPEASVAETQKQSLDRASIDAAGRLILPSPFALAAEQSGLDGNSFRASSPSPDIGTNGQLQHLGPSQALSGFDFSSRRHSSGMGYLEPSRSASPAGQWPRVPSALATHPTPTPQPFSAGMVRDQELPKVVPAALARRTKSTVLQRAMSSLWTWQQRRHSSSSEQNERPYATLSKDQLAEAAKEARIRLLTGIKRYVHAKRAEGLLSPEGLLRLDEACDHALDSPDKPINVYAAVRRETAETRLIKACAALLFKMRRFSFKSRRWRFQAFWATFLRRPLAYFGGFLSGILSQRMLESLEIAMEYWLALRWSPQSVWTLDPSHHSPLLGEVRSEIEQVFRFIVRREIEAPSRFQAVQTYRATMAILKQLTNFVEQLFESGMIDETEMEQLQAPIDKKTRHLEAQGPSWKIPVISELLRKAPFFQHLSPRLFERILADGRVARFARGDIVWTPMAMRHSTGDALMQSRDSAPAFGGIIIIISGLIKTTSKPSSSKAKPQDHFFGSGGILGLPSALTGVLLPEAGPATAVCNALQTGPVTFHVPQTLINDLRCEAANGNQELQQLELDLFRVAALSTVDRMQASIASTVRSHVEQVVAADAHRSTSFLRRSSKKLGPKAPGRAGEDTKLQGRALMEAAFSEKNLSRQSLSRRSLSSMQLPRRQSQEEPMISRVSVGSAGSVLEELEAAEEEIQHLASEVVTALKVGLRGASLVKLDPLETIAQHSSLVLLYGSLRATNQSDKPTTKFPDKLAPRPLKQSAQARLSSLFSIEGSPPEKPSVIQEETEDVSDEPGDSSVPRQQPDEPAESHQAADESLRARGRQWLEGCSSQQRQGRRAASSSNPSVSPRPLQQYSAPCVLPWLWDFALDRQIDAQAPSSVVMRAGPSGATIVLCPSLSNESDESPSSSADEH
ncbi:hypothetical protein WJX74_000240 [Apatococcus lobatus]|uniref:Cation/H+ exchanger transmembrane domain-containing protein n=1 Tax=Apatococcus lobatus TaxID=904363 RepID=A0AAW1RDA2_9CHLO